MYCSQCGAWNEDGAAFCSNCGSTLVTQKEQAISQPQMQVAANNSEATSKPMVEVMVIGIIASAIFTLGAFLPYARVLFVQISLIDGGIMSDAGFVLFLGLLGIGASCAPKRSVTILIIGILQLGLVFLKSSSVPSGSFSYSSGYYCLWIGGFITFLTGIYGIIKRSKM